MAQQKEAHEVVEYEDAVVSKHVFNIEQFRMFPVPTLSLVRHLWLFQSISWYHIIQQHGVIL
jgi:hypothetical protein